MKRRAKKRPWYQSGKQTWFLADLVERSETQGERVRPNGRYLTWVNTLLIRASSIEKAYEEAMKAAKQYNSRYTAVSGRNVRWRVLGLASLLPIYEPLKHGAEIMWSDRGYLTPRHSERMVRSKRELVKESNG